MKEVEKNDVDISKLFNWSKKVTLNYGEKKYTVYVKLVGDAEFKRAQTFALRKSADLRKKLRDEDSDERLGIIPAFDIMTKEEIINGLLISYTRQFTFDAYKELKFNVPKEPSSDATLEERENYQKEIDEFPIKREEAIREFVIKKMENMKNELDKDDAKTLYKRLVDGTIAQLCETEMVNRFREMCAYFGLFMDKDFTRKVFKSYEEFENLPTEIKNKFVDIYYDLEMDTDTLKKSLEVVQ